MNLSRKKTIAIIFILVISAVSAIGQNNINFPQAIVQYQTNIPFDGDNREKFYSFIGKGNISITLDLKALTDNAGVSVDFLNTKGKTLSETEFIQAVNRGTDRAVKNLSLGNKYQTIILKVKSISYGSRESYPGNLKISLDGSFSGLRNDSGSLVSFGTKVIDFESTTELNWTGKQIDSPRMINTRYSVLNFKGDDKEQFFAFYAKGKVEITYDVKANSENAGTYLTLLDRNGDELAGQEVAQATNYGTNRITQIVELDQRQLVIIKIVSISYGSKPSYPGRLKITLKSGFAG